MLSKIRSIEGKRRASQKARAAQLAKKATAKPRTTRKKLKTEYDRYIASPEWARKRQQYFTAVQPKTCAACPRPWVNSHHIHHMTYERMGHELLTDLVHLCPDCHDVVHRIHARKGKRSLRETTEMVIRQGLRGRRDLGDEQ